MFNVSWSDPASETVAQHRERKERDERNSIQSSAASSLRSVQSDDSSNIRSAFLLAKSTKVGTSKQPTTPKSGKPLLKNAKGSLAGKKPSLDTAGTSPDSQQTIKAVHRGYPDDINGHARDSVADTLHSAPLSTGTTTSNTQALYEEDMASANLLRMHREIKYDRVILEFGDG